LLQEADGSQKTERRHLPLCGGIRGSDMGLPVILAIISAGVLLVYFFKGPNAVWGGATAGVIIGLIVGFITGNVLNGMLWGFAVGTLAGFAAELLGKVSDRMRQRQ
jgi:hypothetical protein